MPRKMIGNRIEWIRNDMSWRWCHKTISKSIVFSSKRRHSNGFDGCFSFRCKQLVSTLKRYYYCPFTDNRHIHLAHANGTLCSNDSILTNDSYKYHMLIISDYNNNQWFGTVGLTAGDGQK